MNVNIHEREREMSVTLTHPKDYSKGVLSDNMDHEHQSHQGCYESERKRKRERVCVCETERERERE